MKRVILFLVLVGVSAMMASCSRTNDAEMNRAAAHLARQMDGWLQSALGDVVSSESIVPEVCGSFSQETRQVRVSVAVEDVARATGATIEYVESDLNTTVEESTQIPGVWDFEYEGRSYVVRRGDGEVEITARTDCYWPAD